jgi:hypothetical protein
LKIPIHHTFSIARRHFLQRICWQTARTIKSFQSVQL